MMILDRNTSERLSILRFPLIIGVVFIHAYSPEVTLGSGVFGLTQSGPVSNFIRDCISQGIARVAVPLFFLLSGYFYFFNSSWTLKEYRKKTRARFKTLMIPFLFWNLLTLAFFFLTQQIPALHFYFPERDVPIESYSILQWCDAIFGIYNSPVSYPFWFIRDLIMLVLFTPGIFFLLETVPTIALALVIGMWVTDFIPYSMPSPTAFTFFYLGAFIAHQKISIFAGDRWGRIVLWIYPVVQILDALTKNWKYNGYLHNVCIILGMGAALTASKMLAANAQLKSRLLWLSGCSFLVFAMHEPLLMLCRRTAYHFINPKSDFTIILLYFLVPAMVIIFSVFVHEWMKNRHPKILSFVTGGR